MPAPQRGKYGPQDPDQDIDDDLLEPPVHLNKSLKNIVVVDNIPVVPQDKYEKLKAVLVKIFNSFAGPVQQLELPQDASNSTKGFCFVEFETEEIANVAIEKVDGYKLDKQHTFKVTSFEDFEKYLNVPDTYVEPQVPAFETRDNLRTWLLDERGSDQYALRYGEWTEVVWNESAQGENPESVVKREHWTELYVSWSPLGTYLITIHPAGVQLWGGPNWAKLGKFPHHGVKLVDFSPCEKYLVTASPQFAENDNPKDPQCIIVWDIRSGQKLRGFLGQVGDKKQIVKDKQESVWPAFKWSFDDKYLARMGEEAISIYETPSLDLLDKKSLKIPDLKDFAWSPSDHLISYFVPESSNKPASLVLLEIPSRKEKRSKNLFSVSDCKMYWSSSGDYLCARVDRTTKTKKSTFTDLELFRIREKDIPIEHLEIKEPITHISWEPKGYKIGVIFGEGPKPNVGFWTMDGKFRHLKTVEKRSANSLVWSPNGGFVVMAGLGTLNGTFEFYNTNDLESMGVEEHFNASSVEWDPTGRFVTTVVSFYKHQIETGYNLYSFQGKLLKRVLKDRFFELKWRPRPPSLLSDERIAHIKKNINEFAKELKEEDRKKDEEEAAKRRAKRQALRDQFNTIIQAREKEWETNLQTRRDLGFEDEEDEKDFEFREQWVEEVLEVQEKIIRED